MRFGQKTTPYNIGAPVLVRGGAKWGPGRIIKITPDGVMYVVKFCRDTPGDHTTWALSGDLKPATENAAKRAEAKQLALEAEYEAKKKHRDDLMAKVAAAEPLNLSTAELIKRGMENGLSFEIAIRKGDEEFEAALLFDNLSRNLYGVGYAGCKKINYSPGDRVRYLGASRFGSSDVVSRGTLGIVFRNDQSKVLDIFGNSSMQPKGIMVRWDNDLGGHFVYVTEVEPA